MPIQEIGRELSRIYFPETETNRRLGELTEEIQMLRREIEQLRETPSIPTAGPLGVTDVNQLIKYMDKRFQRMTDESSDTEESE